MMKITFGSATCSVDEENGMSDFDNFFSACEGAFAANGMTFCDAAADYLCERDFVVMTQDELDEMLEDARNGSESTDINDLPKAKAAFSQEDYDAGYHDGYNGEDAQDDQSASYYDGYETGKEIFEGEE